VKTTLSPNGLISLPAALHAQDGIEPGDEFTIQRIGRGEYRLRRCASIANDGVVDWLLACPEKGFFVPIESS
jgi:hypothetical protein